MINKWVLAFKQWGTTEGFAFFAWLIRTFFEKKLIQLQNKFHLYRYRTWIDLYERDGIPPSAPLQTDHPLASFLVIVQSVNDTTQKDIEATLDAMGKQNIPNWECLVFLPASAKNYRLPISPNPANKISLFYRDDSVDINQALRTAQSVMQGDWLIWTHPGDIHSKDLLNRLMPFKGDIVYWDEDQQIHHSRRKPFLKPDWSPELWLSINLLYCAAFRRDFLQSIVLLDEKQQIISECVLAAPTIEHIRTVLTHCKYSAWEDSVNLLFHQANVLDYLKRSGVDQPEITLRSNASLKAAWKTPFDKISIIIPTKDHYAILSRCLQSIFQQTIYPNYEIILVDDHSNDPQVLDYYQELIKLNHPVQLIQGKKPFNYSRACNQGAKSADGKYLLFLNNDTEVLNPTWLNELVQFASLKDIGVVGGKLLYPDYSIQHAGIILGLEGHASHVFLGAAETIQTPFGMVNWVRNYSAVTGACMMLRKEVFDELGGYDETYLLVFSDIEICLRAISHRYRIVYNPDVCLIHHEGKSRGKYIPKEDILLGYQHFLQYCIQGDPYFNPGLSYAWRVPTLRRSWEQTPAERLEKIKKYFSGFPGR